MFLDRGLELPNYFSKLLERRISNFEEFSSLELQYFSQQTYPKISTGKTYSVSPKLIRINCLIKLIKTKEVNNRNPISKMETRNTEGKRILVFFSGTVIQSLHSYLVEKLNYRNEAKNILARQGIFN